MRLYDFKDYKLFLKNIIEHNHLSKGYQTRLAQAAGCSKSFLSQVLSTSMDVDLTRDHAAGLCRFWEMSADELEYFLALVDLTKTKSSALAEHTEKKIASLREKQKRLSSRVESEKISTAQVEAIYYSSWLLGAIHVLLTNRKYRDPKSISARLKIEISEADRALEKLEGIGLAKREHTGWIALKNDLNLAESSPMSAVNHMNWRHKAIASLQTRKSTSLHYSSIFTIGADDLEALKGAISDLIVRSRKTIIDSSDERLSCINIDCFEP